MPQRAASTCVVCGTPITQGRRCEQHRLPPSTRTPDERPSAAQRGYDYKWRNFRYAWFASNPGSVCACGCGARVDVTNADLDHKIPFQSKDDPLRFDPSNMQPFLHGHHTVKTNKSRGGAGQNFEKRSA